MGKVKDYMIEQQDYAEEMAIALGSQDLDLLTIDDDDVIAQDKALEYAKSILTPQHTITEMYEGKRKKIFRVNKKKIEEMFPADDGSYLDWNAFVSATEGAMYSIANDEYKKALERLLDSKYIVRLRWIPNAVGIVIE